MKLTYRMNIPADKASLIKLWTEDAQWDQIDEEIWEHRFGKAAIAVAIDEATDKIVGQAVFIPTAVNLNGREIAAYRPFAAFLTKEARSFQTLNPLKHPMFKMYQMATDIFRQNGVGLIQMLPDPLWSRILQLVPSFQIAKFPLWSLKLPLTQNFLLPDGYEVVEISPTDQRLDALWEKSARLYGCAAVRDSATLTWKTSHHRFSFHGIERRGELVGFVDSRLKSRDKQWLIGDIIAADANAFKTTILAVCNQINDYNQKNPEEKVDKVAILACELILPIVQDLGFFRDRYNFLFVIQRLDKSLSMEEIAPSHWYVSAND